MNETRYFDLPYNFVPLSGFVHRPADLARGISQDVPFEDGLCGVLDIELVALRDLLVSRGTERDEKGPGQAHMFELMRPDGAKPAIPSTSVRGMVRSVLEIASFGKMSRVDDRRFSAREARANFYTARVSKVIDFFQRENETTIADHARRFFGGRGVAPLARSGWLYRKLENGTYRWFIRECEHGRVSMALLESECEISGGARKSRELAIRNHWLHCFAVDPYTEAHFSHGLAKIAGPNKSRPQHLIFGNIDKFCKISDDPSDSLKCDGDDRIVNGYFVFTNIVEKKKRQFFFYNEVDCEYPLSGEVFSKFLEANRRPEEVEPSEEDADRTTWAYWESELRAGRVGPGSGNEPGIPIFFLGKDDPEAIGGTKVLAFGLAQMMRIPYDLSVREIIKNTSEDHFAPAGEPDLAEIIFGTASDEGASWRGRVSFSHLEAENAKIANGNNGVRLVLNSPKPSFFPAYVEQPEQNFRSYMAAAKDRAGSEVRGWKRYQAVKEPTLATDLVYKPAYFKHGIPAPPDQEAGDKLATRLYPVMAGTRFSGRMHLHNLRPVELGALLWAMGLGEDVTSAVEDRRGNHVIGMGKPFGFGRCGIRITGGVLEPNLRSSTQAQGVTLTACLHEAVRAFEDHMERHYRAADKRASVIDPPSWRDSPQIRALQSLADPGRHEKAAPHPRLIPKGYALRRTDGRLEGYEKNSRDEFANLKKDKARLRPVASNVLDQKMFPRPKPETEELPDLPNWLRAGGSKQADEKA